MIYANKSLRTCRGTQETLLLLLIYYSSWFREDWTQPLEFTVVTGTLPLIGTVGYAAMKLPSSEESQRFPPVSSNQLFWLKSTNATNEDKVWALK